MDITGKEETLLMLAIFTNQAGNVAGTVNHLLRTEDEEEIKAFRHHLKCDLGDTIMMLNRLVKHMKFDKDEIKELGYARYEEAKLDWRKRGKGGMFI